MTASTAVQAARETAQLLNGVVMGSFTAALVKAIETGAADLGRTGRILLSDLRHYLARTVIGSTPQFFDRRATGDPLISLSPATAAPSRETYIPRSVIEGILGDPPWIQQREVASKQREAAFEALKKIEALTKIRPDAAEAVPALVAALKDPNKDTRQSAAYMLGEIGPDALGAVPALAAALEDRHEDVRESAAYALGKMGPAAAEAVPILIGALKGKIVRWGVPYALGKIGPAAAQAVPALAAALKDEDVHIRWGAAIALGEIGPDAAEAVPALVAALKDHDGDVRQRAAYALERIQNKKTA